MLAPLISMRGLPTYPGWVVPSIVTPASASGRASSGVIVRGVLGMLNATMPPAAEFASRIACLSEPGPLSFVFVTEKVAADAQTAISSAAAAIPKRILGMLSPFRRFARQRTGLNYLDAPTCRALRDHRQ